MGTVTSNLIESKMQVTQYMSYLGLNSFLILQQFDNSLLTHFPVCEFVKVLLI